MTLEEQRDYWEERYTIETNKNKELNDNLYEANNIISDYVDTFRELQKLIDEMNKNGSKYWADRINNIINK